MEDDTETVSSVSSSDSGYSSSSSSSTDSETNAKTLQLPPSIMAKNNNIDSESGESDSEQEETPKNLLDEKPKSLLDDDDNNFDEQPDDYVPVKESVKEKKYGSEYDYTDSESETPLENKKSANKHKEQERKEKERKEKDKRKKRREEKERQYEEAKRREEKKKQREESKRQEKKRQAEQINRQLEEVKRQEEEEVKRQEEEKTKEQQKPIDDAPQKPTDDTMEEDSLLYLTIDPKKLRKLPTTEIPSLKSSASPVVPQKTPEPKPNSRTTTPQNDREFTSPFKVSSGDNKSPTAVNNSSPNKDNNNSNSSPNKSNTNNKTPGSKNASVASSRTSSASSRTTSTNSNAKPSSRHSTSESKRSTSSRHSTSDTRQRSTDRKGDKETSMGRKQSSRSSSRSTSSSSNSTSSSRSSRSNTTSSRVSSSRRGETKTEYDPKREERRHRKKERGERFRRAVLDEEMKEKRELIWELFKMEKDGHPVGKRYTMNDDLDEIRFDYHKLKSEDDVKEKVRIGWNMFSCVNSLVELINEKLDPFDLSIDGWCDELDKEKEKYEPHFRKLYKQMSVKFQIKPAVQIGMLFMSQFMVFIVPKFLSKVKSAKGKNQAKGQQENPKEAAYHPWDQDAVPKGPSAYQYAELMRAMDKMKKNMHSYSKQLKERDELLNKQQIIIETFKNAPSSASTTSPVSVSEKVLDKQDLKKALSNDDVPELETEDGVEYVDVEEEEKDNQDQEKAAEEEDNDQKNDEESEEETEKVTDCEATDLPAPGDAAGGMLDISPMLKILRRAKKKELPQELDVKMFTEEPEKPDYVKEAEAQEDKKLEEETRKTSRGRSGRVRNSVLKLQ
jgi:hypothetical protein